MVAVAVQARRRDQGGEMVDRFQRGEEQRRASVALWLRQTIDDADGQVAAIAATSGLVLVTRNVEDFRWFTGLQVENWFE
jgi:predicted nucleic acid-binding protein